MASFPQLNIFEQIIDLPEFKVKNYRFIKGFGLVLIVEKKEKKACCTSCGKKSDKLHQNYRYLVRDLPIMKHDVYLKVNRRQFKCSHCQKPFTEHFDSIKKTRTYTERLAEKIIAEVVESDVKNVAQRNGEPMIEN
ncbi:MAG: transposase family protein [Xenococcaceae cyanobacterium MO_167.B27]|nr:transposase family protein [Xenococcaceae cyanobacterium MO_167.B27]